MRASWKTAKAWLAAARGHWALPVAIAAFAALAFLGVPQFVLIAAAVAIKEAARAGQNPFAPAEGDPNTVRAAYERYLRGHVEALGGEQEVPAAVRAEQHRPHDVNAVGRYDAVDEVRAILQNGVVGGKNDVA